MCTHARFPLETGTTEESGRGWVGEAGCRGYVRGFLGAWEEKERFEERKELRKRLEVSEENLGSLKGGQ